MTDLQFWYAVSMAPMIPAALSLPLFMVLPSRYIGLLGASMLSLILIGFVVGMLGMTLSS